MIKPPPHTKIATYSTTVSAMIVLYCFGFSGFCFVWAFFFLYVCSLSGCYTVWFLLPQRCHPLPRAGVGCMF